MREKESLATDQCCCSITTERNTTSINYIASARLERKREKKRWSIRLKKLFFLCRTAVLMCMYVYVARVEPPDRCGARCRATAIIIIIALKSLDYTRGRRKRRRRKKPTTTTTTQTKEQTQQKILILPPKKIGRGTIWKMRTSTISKDFAIRMWIGKWNSSIASYLLASGLLTASMATCARAAAAIYVCLWFEIRSIHIRYRHGHRFEDKI